ASFIPEDTQTIQQDDSLFDEDTQYESIVSSQRWSEPPETAPEARAIMPRLKSLELMSVPGIPQGSNTQDKCRHEEVDYSHKLRRDLYEKHRVINQLRGRVRQLKEQEAVLHNIDDRYQMACVEIENQKRKVMELQGIMERREEVTLFARNIYRNVATLRRAFRVSMKQPSISVEPISKVSATR
ncbi:hypothetical protein BKA82DRAFT_11436, partial [Pisolithus tinctorius]